MSHWDLSKSHGITISYPAKLQFVRFPAIKLANVTVEGSANLNPSDTQMCSKVKLTPVSQILNEMRWTKQSVSGLVSHGPGVGKLKETSSGIIRIQILLDFCVNWRNLAKAESRTSS